MKFYKHKDLNTQKYFQTYACALAKETQAAELLSPMKEFQAVACIRGFHVFKDTWEAALSEESMCEWESHNQ